MQALIRPVDRSQTRRRFSRGRCAGVTVVEILVALAVMSLIMALLLPAVQSVREQARKTQCQDHLRQLAIACHAHETFHRAFPYTATRFSDSSEVIRASISAHAHLLPFLDQAQLHATIDFEHCALDLPGSLPASFKCGPLGETTDEPVNGEALSTTVRVFLCPSDAARPAGNNYRTCMGYGPGIFGPDSNAICPFEGNGTGAFVNGRMVRPAEIRDGLSQTAFLSERLIGDGDPDHYTPWTDFFYFEGNICTADEATSICQQFATPDAAHDSYAGTTWLFGSRRQTWYNHILPPNSSIPDCSAGGVDMFGGGHGPYAARSYHPGGVNVVFADSSIRFVASQVDLAVWRAMSTRDGADVVDLL